MKSFPGKFPSVRGWALAPALLLGAGIMISACGDEEVPAPTTPAPPAPVPPPEPEPEPTGPATPEELLVTGITSSSITWSWGAVEGAIGYNVQFGPNSLAFTDTTPPPQPTTNTFWTVSNLAGNTTIHLRVRTIAGTLAEQVVGDWSDPAPGTTALPPAATALDAPGNFRSTDRDETSVSLAWDEVEDAAGYEVQEREAGDSGWQNSSCGGGGNEVTDTACVASGLSEGVAYDFRVRALPAAADTEFEESAWTGTTSAVTTLGATDPGAAGGGGELEITWSSDASDSLIFTWNRMGDARYETAGIRAVDISTSDPCDGKTFTLPNVDTTISVVNPPPGEAVGVCVRVEDDESTTSYAFGVAKPAAHAPFEGGETDENDSDRNRHLTTRLNWTGINEVEGFDFELRLVADPGRMDEINTDTDDDDIQAACSDGAFLAQRTATRTIAVSHAVTSGLTPYTGYLLCVRHRNGAGATNWIVPVDNAEHHTLPAAPPSPSPDSSRTAATNDGEDFDVTWTVDLRNRATVPWPKTGFVVMNTNPLPSSSTPKPEVCEDGGLIGDADVAETLDGIEFDRTYRRPMAHLANHYAFACIRAEAEDLATRLGPWTIGGRVTIPKKVAELTAEQAATTVTLTLEGHTDDDGADADWYYKANSPPHASCTDNGSNDLSDTTRTLTVGTNPGDLTAGTSYTYTAYGDEECTQPIDSVSFRAE